MSTFNGRPRSLHQLPLPDPFVNAAVPSSLHERARSDLAAHLQFISRWRWMIAGFAATGLLLGLALGLAQVPIYEARLALEVENLNSEFLNMKQVQPLDEGGVTNPFSDIQTQIKILQSDILHREVVERMSSKHDGFELPPRLQSFRLPASLVRVSATDALMREAVRTAASIQVRALGQTRIIEVTARSSDPRFAADFLNELNTAYIEQNMRARWEMGQRTSEALQKVLEESRLKLRDSESALQNYALNSDMVFLSQNNNVADQKLSELQDELSKAQENRIAAQANLELAALVRGDDGSGLPDSISQGGVRDDRTKLVELRRQRAELAALYTPNYVGIQRLDAEIASVETSLAAEKQNIRAQLQNEYRAAQRRESLLRSEYERQTQLVAGLAKRSVQFNMLQREVQGDRQVYDEVLKQVKDASIATAMGASNIRTVDPAVPPVKPKGPGTILDGVFGLFSFSAVGMLVARLRDASHTTFHEPGDLFASTGLVELGFIPHDERGLTFFSVPQVQRAGDDFRSGSPFSNFMPRIPGRPLLPERSSYDGMPIAEAYRNVVVSLLSKQELPAARLVAITSALAGEGKTTVVANLGSIFAAAGKRALLVDADLMKGGLSHLLHVHEERGLSDLLESAAPSPPGADQDFSQFIKPGRTTGVSVLPSGAYRENCRNRLHLPVLGQILLQVAALYDFVLVDTPSVIPLADARLVSQLCDGVVLVVRSGRSVLEAVTLTRGRLEMSGARILGTVLNDWDVAHSTMRHYAMYYESAIPTRNSKFN